MNASDIEDALHPRMAGSTEGMTLQVLAQIRDSLTALTRDVRSANEATADVRERVIRLEENNRRLDDVEARQKVSDAKIDVLMRDKDSRDGAVGFLNKVPTWVSFVIALCSALTALYLAGRQVGVISSPPTTPARVEATIHPEERLIEGVVEGNP